MSLMLNPWLKCMPSAIKNETHLKSTNRFQHIPGNDTAISMPSASRQIAQICDN